MDIKSLLENTHSLLWGRLLFTMALALLAPLQAAADLAPLAITDSRASDVTLTTPAVQLKALLNPLITLRADFSQRVFSVDAYEIQSSQGEMHVARPGKLRWIIAPPMEQWLISDGQTLWLYDPDLEQVIVRPFQHSVADTPAMLFSGGADQLEESYTVSLNSSGDLTSFVLKPLISTGLYEQITLVFEGDKPTQIVIIDSLSQRTEIILSNVQLNLAMSAEQIDLLYRFTPPPGVDVLQDD